MSALVASSPKSTPGVMIKSQAWAPARRTRSSQARSASIRIRRGEPGQRIEPVDGEGELRDGLGEAVEPADVS